ncbi:MAG: hypothetical protein V2J24_05135 [Pseudomonadales bacterium]|jgi:hypothetical protein|nr:hypothetical protein [Pseudomonadales bacterium]
MFPIVRMYESGQTAQDVVAALASEECVSAAMDRAYKPFSAHALAPGKDNAVTVRAAVADGIVPSALAPSCTAGLERGRHVVVVACRFGFARQAEKTLDAAGPVDVDRVPEYTDSSSMLFSDFIGIPTLTSRKTPLSDLLGMNALKKGPAMGGNVSDFSFSGMFGLPLLAKSGPILGGGTSNFSFSGMFGMPLLTKPSADSSLGFSTLSKNPTPLSSAFGLKTLTTESRDEG